MADVTISSLTRSTPTGGNILPFSTNSNTLGVPVSALYQSVSDSLYINSSPIVIPGKGIVLSSDDSAGTSIFLNNQTTNKSWRLVSTGSANTGGGSRFGIVNHTDDEANYKLVILSGGNVGVGTNSPVAKLDVNGTIKATGLNVPGTVLKVVQSYMREYQDISPSSGWTDIVSPIDGVGLICSITPNYTTSKIFVQACINWDGNTSAPIFRLVRNNAFLAAGNSGAGSVNNAFGGGWGFGSSYTPQCNMVQYLDSPNSVASQTYKIQATGLYNNTTLKINRSQDNQSGFTSSITLMEIAG